MAKKREQKKERGREGSNGVDVAAEAVMAEPMMVDGKEDEDDDAIKAKFNVGDSGYMQSASPRYYFHFGSCSDAVYLYLSLANFSQASTSLS